MENNEKIEIDNSKSRRLLMVQYCGYLFVQLWILMMTDLYRVGLMQGELSINLSPF